MPVYLKQAPARSRAADQAVIDTVSQILSEIEKEGERAVRRWSERLDGWSPDRFTVSAAEIAAAAGSVPDDLKRDLAYAQAQVTNFARLQLETIKPLEVETLPGVILGHRLIPVGSVGSYSPGGRYPLIASSIMTVAVPKVAGVPEVIAVAPPRDERGMYGPQLYTMAQCHADQILCLGGVQALAALAFGIEDVSGVDMVVGAGNAYVAEAKRQLFGRVGIDLLAGPTEIAIIADRHADPELLAADLLGQAEHGPTSPAVLICTDRQVAEQTMEFVKEWLRVFPTAEVAAQAWESRGEVIVCDSADEAIEVSDRYAFEHLELQVADTDYYFERLANYGSLFIGEEATVAYGDKAIGVNHVLPTERAARYTGGLWVGKFIKTLTYQRVTQTGSKEIAPVVSAISDAELMAGHAITARLRLSPNERPSRNSRA